MAPSAAKTVPAYLASLPADRRKSRVAVRKMLKASVGQPLCYAGLAAQNNHLSLHLMGPYSHPTQAGGIKEAFRKAGKRLNMGKSCIRFKTADDIPLAALGKLVARISPAQFIVRYEELTRK